MTWHRTKRRRHTPDQIILKLVEGNKLLASGQELDEVCPHLEIAAASTRASSWLAEYGADPGDQAKSSLRGRGRKRPAEVAVRQPGPRHRHAQGHLGDKVPIPSLNRRAATVLC